MVYTNSGRLLPLIADRAESILCTFSGTLSADLHSGNERYVERVIGTIPDDHPHRTVEARSELAALAGRRVFGRVHHLFEL